MKVSYEKGEVSYREGYHCKAIYSYLYVNPLPLWVFIPIVVLKAALEN